MNEEITKIIKDVNEAVNNTITEYGPEAMNIVFWLIRIQGLQWIIVGSVSLGVAIYCYRSLPTDWKEQLWIKGKDSYNNVTYWPNPAIWLRGIGLIIGTFFVLFNLCNVWNYVYFLMPKVGLAKEVMDKVLGAP